MYLGDSSLTNLHVIAIVVGASALLVVLVLVLVVAMSIMHIYRRNQRNKTAGIPSKNNIKFPIIQATITSAHCE